MLYKFFLLFFLIFSNNLNAQHAKNFSAAKQMARHIWNDHRETFYCRCPYDKHGIIDFRKCDYHAKKKHFANRISWEHVVPVSWYGQKLSCWTKPLCKTKEGKRFKGRKCCKKISPLFRKMEADLHNLVPVIKEVNLARENYHFAEFPIEKRAENYFNHCPFIIDKSLKTVEPRDEIKGMVARISLYIADKYGIDLGERQRELLTEWNNRFKVSPWEKQWNQQVANIQGDNNYYITPQGTFE